MLQTVLIVDDTIENIDILKAILSDEYSIRAATRGKVALKIAEKVQPDIILLDIMMPEMDGYEVCAKLKENPKTSHIPVIFVTAMSEEQDEAKGFEVGAIDYVTKPISPVIVKARLNTHLALSNQQRELDKLVKEKTSELQASRLDLVQRLGIAAEYKDSDTGLHVVRVGKYSKLLAIEVGLSDKEIETIELASPMHDVGKIGIEDEILKKRGKLTNEEYDRMKSHSVIGESILGTHSDKLLATAAIMARQHHERWDGSGYPDGVKKENISLYARIVAIADVFDALTTKRPYKEPWEFDKAFRLILSEKGKHFDPHLVDAFERVYDNIKEIHDKYKD